MTNKSALLPLDEFFIRPNKSLFWELATNVSGLGLKNTLAFLKAIGVESNFDKCTYETITAEQQDALLALIRKRQFSTTFRDSNKKRRTSPETNLLNPLMIGVALKVNTKRDIIILKKEKCRIGDRHNIGLKVHGQRTRTTGKASTMNSAKETKTIRGSSKTKKK